MKTKNAPMVVRVGLVILAGAMTPLCRLGHGRAIAHDWPDDFSHGLECVQREWFRDVQRAVSQVNGSWSIDFIRTEWGNHAGVRSVSGQCPAAMKDSIRNHMATTSSRTMPTAWTICPKADPA